MSNLSLAQDNGLVTIENNRIVTTSLKVAECFGKRHSDVIRAIKKLECSQDFHQRNFASMVEMKELPQGGATKCEYYFISRDGFTFLVMGYTGKAAAKFKEDFINAIQHNGEIEKSRCFPCGLKNIPTFATLQDDDCIRFAGQAVNLLNCLLGFFYARKFAGDINVGSKLYKDIGGCLYVRFIFARVANTPSCSSVYGSRFFVAKPF